MQIYGFVNGKVNAIPTGLRLARINFYAVVVVGRLDSAAYALETWLG